MPEDQQPQKTKTPGTFTFRPKGPTLEYFQSLIDSGKCANAAEAMVHCVTVAMNGGGVPLPQPKPSKPISNPPIEAGEEYVPEPGIKTLLLEIQKRKHISPLNAVIDYCIRYTRKNDWL